MLRRKLIWVILVTSSGLAFAGCKRHDAPPVAGIQASELPKIIVAKKRPKLLFTYYAGSRFESTDKLASVPEQRRGWIRVVDLSMKPETRRDHELVYVADLRKAKADGSYPYVVMSRVAFELAARNRVGLGATDPPSAQVSVSDKVILYSTAWCPACKSARQYLKKSGIPFVERDIEKDPQAAAELMRKAKAAGISASGVPVLDVRGTLMQGFDPQRLAKLLGAKK